MTLFKTLKPYVQFDDSRKKKAWNALEQMGFPTKKWDAFKYVSLKALSESSFTPIVKTFPKSERVISLPLKQAMRFYGVLLQKSFAENLSLETDPFALLNGALFNEGRFIYVPPKTKVDLSWDFLLEEGLRTPRIELFVGEKATLSLTSRCKGKTKYFYNPYLQITLNEGSCVKFDQYLEHSSEAFAMHTMRVHLKKDARLKFFAFSKGARCERHNVQVLLSGENGEVELKGLSLPNKKNEIHHFITVRHEAAKTRSNEHFKTVLTDRALSSFDGRIIVEKEARKTEAYQLNNNLLLSPKAKAMSKPNLKISADDVKASHGATVTQPKQEEIFYLQTRGLSLHEAKRQLAQGFCRELMNEETADRFLRVPGDDKGV